MLKERGGHANRSRTRRRPRSRNRATGEELLLTRSRHRAWDFQSLGPDSDVVSILWTGIRLCPEGT